MYSGRLWRDTAGRQGIESEDEATCNEAARGERAGRLAAYRFWYLR